MENQLTAIANILGANFYMKREGESYMVYYDDANSPTPVPLFTTSVDKLPPKSAIDLITSMIPMFPYIDEIVSGRDTDSDESV